MNLSLGKTLLCLIVGGLPFLVQTNARANDPDARRRRIEADWLRQDEVRGKPDQDRGKTQPKSAQKKVTPAEDAAGAVDGHIDGFWGFHTANEPNPWWQVDLGQTARLDRIVLYNRCDRAAMGDRNNRIIVLFSDDGLQFAQAYQHDGTKFQGKPDGKPLSVDLGGKTTRFVRLQLPDTSYFHLDEVELYSPQSDRNIALHRPATQSSTSAWSTPPSVEAPIDPVPATGPEYATERIVRQGFELAESLTRLDANVRGQVDELRRVATHWKALPADAPQAERRDLYLQARWIVREMAMSNRLLDFDEVLFVKRASTLFPHMSDQFYGWWSRGGGGVYVLSDIKSDSPRLRCLTDDWPEGNFLRPDLSHDGRRVLFAYCTYHADVAGVADKTRKEDLPEDAFYHVFEMNVDGSDIRQLTHGRYDDFDARYLPDGDIIFLSTRKGTALRTDKSSVQATREATRPDSFVRCGGGELRPVSVFTLHRMEQDGQDLRPISAFENFEWTPSVAADGRLLYARWDYIDRFNGPFVSLWSMLPDGRGARLVYGNYTEVPQCVFEARPVPNSQQLMFTAAAHHSIVGGSIGLLDRTRGTEFDRPITRLTPEVCFPETEGWPASYYSGPWPLSEEHFLVAWSDRPLPKHTRFDMDDPRNPRNASGIYLADAFGNLNLLYRDPTISCTNPIPLRSRVKPRSLPSGVDWDGPREGLFLLQDVYQGLEGIERGTVKRLRIVAVPPKVQPKKNSPVLGISAEEPGKYVLGSVAVEEDGSAYFRVPSGVPVFFQALDEQGMTVQTMRSLTYVQPGEAYTCIGCHESRDAAPARILPTAVTREPSRITPGPEGTWPLRYDRLVQPVLDRNCVACHKPGAEDPTGAEFDLTADRSHETLLSYADKDLHKLVHEKDFSVVGDCPARKSKLLALLTDVEGHQGVRLEPEDLDRLIVWMDTYAHRQGAFSAEQEAELVRFRQEIADLLDP